jgi:D-beta-D-heptose 7-phosphate kinase / D-beta-D-heptose 1-phosphate adenosyltransferase
MSRRIVVVGDVVLDRDVEGSAGRLAPDAPVPVLDVGQVTERPGGAGLTALLCRAPGVAVRLLAPLADDEAGHRLRELLGEAGVEVVALGHRGATRTKTRLRAAGQSLLRMDDGGPGAPLDVAAERVSAALADADVVVVSDYGAGTTGEPAVRAALSAVRRPVVWDPHPRGSAPVPGVTLVTPNRSEAAALLPGDGEPEALGSGVREKWQARAVCVTAGARGAYLVQAGSEPMFVPAPVVADGDPCGAGDRFAAAAAVALAEGKLVSEAVVEAVAQASAWVAGDGAAGFRRPPAVVRPAGDLDTLLTRVRSDGGQVVATGGCFDLLHVGHIASLQAARRAGDALVVLLNSDDSVRRRKGPGRPVVPQAERARVLQALECVDGVIVFDEDDPRAALERLRPDIWVKGADYSGADLPEAGLVRSWGGRVLLLPYVAGRSTTSLLQSISEEAS